MYTYIYIDIDIARFMNRYIYVAHLSAVAP